MQTSGLCSPMIRNGSSPSLQSAARASPSSRGPGGAPSPIARAATQPLVRVGGGEATCPSPPTRKSPVVASPRPLVSMQSQSTLSTSSAIQSDDETVNDQPTSTTTPSATLPRLIVEDADIPASNCFRLVLRNHITAIFRLLTLLFPVRATRIGFMLPVGTAVVGTLLPVLGPLTGSG